MDTILADQEKERNASLASKKKRLAQRQSGQLASEVCGFAFGECYGSLGEGLIQCHHTVPASGLTPGQTALVKDLALVCANCHRMLHRAGERVSIGGQGSCLTTLPRLGKFDIKLLVQVGRWQRNRG